MNKRYGTALLVGALIVLGAFSCTRRPVTPVGNGGATGTTTPTSTQASSSVPFENLTTIDIRPLFQASLVTDPLVSRNEVWKYELSTARDGFAFVPDMRDSPQTWRIVVSSGMQERLIPYAELVLDCWSGEKAKYRLNSISEEFSHFRGNYVSGFVSKDKKLWYVVDDKTSTVCDLGYSFYDDPTDNYTEAQAFKDSEPYIYYVLNTFRFLDE